MIVRNAWTAERTWAPSRHGGVGNIENWHIFESEDWESPLTIIGFDTLPPGSAIGEHPHPTEEKLYFVVEGSGIMTVNGEDREVVRGDMIPVKAGGSHGIRNHTDQPLTIMAIECKLTPELKRQSEESRKSGATAH